MPVTWPEKLSPTAIITYIASINTGLLADFRVNSVQDEFADFTNVALTLKSASKPVLIHGAILQIPLLGFNLSL